MPTTATVPSTDGVALAVHDLGGAGPDVVLAHATGFHGLVWAPLAAALGGLHAVAPDLRGHGDSPPPASGDLGWDGFADDVLAVVDALAAAAGGGARAAGGGGPPPRPFGVGHSMGGAALLLAEQRRPGTFAALYLWEPVAFPLPRDGTPLPNPLAEGALRRRPSFPSRAAARENYAGKPPLDALDPAALDAYVAHGLAEGPDGTATLKCRPEVEAAVFRMGLGHGAFEHLGEVACPVVVARGREDPWGPAAAAGRQVAALPHGRLEVFGDLGHFGPLERPAEVAGAVMRAFAVPEGVTPPA